MKPLESGVWGYCRTMQIAKHLNDIKHQVCTNLRELDTKLNESKEIEMIDANNTVFIIFNDYARN